MDNNYVKDASDPEFICYNFERRINTDELLSLFERMEQNERVQKINYYVRTVTDEYETGIYHFDKVDNIDRQLLDNFNTKGINMSFYIKPNEENILVCGINTSTISLRSNNGLEASEVVESCLTKQMNR